VTEGEGASQEAPGPLVVKTFLVYWSDGGSSEYNHIVGSGLENGIWFLVNDVGTQFFINMEFVMHMILSDEP
jgi:hypothetical protein